MTGSADDIGGLYRRHAIAWTTARGERFDEQAWLDRFRSLMRDGEAALDLGCGAGVPIARYLVGHGHPVTGIDGSPEMIALFRRNLPGQQAQLADMRTLTSGRRFGGILAWDSFFHLDHRAQRGMFPIFAARAEPGAPLLFTSGTSHGEAIGALEGEPLYHASLDPAEYRHLLDTSGFNLVDHVAQEPGCRRTVWLARRRGDSR